MTESFLFTAVGIIQFFFPLAKLVIAMEELKQCRLQQRNISATVDKLILCLVVLEMYSKLRDQMKTKRHYPELKTLEYR